MIDNHTNLDYEKLIEIIKTLEKENEELKLQLKGTTFCYDEEEHKRLQEENKELKKQLQQREDIINKAKEFAKEHIFQFDGDKDFDALLEILDNKGE